MKEIKRSNSMIYTRFSKDESHTRRGSQTCKDLGICFFPSYSLSIPKGGKPSQILQNPPPPSEQWTALFEVSDGNEKLSKLFQRCSNPRKKRARKRRAILIFHIGELALIVHSENLWIDIGDNFMKNESSFFSGATSQRKYQVVKLFQMSGKWFGHPSILEIFALFSFSSHLGRNKYRIS